MTHGVNDVWQHINTQVSLACKTNSVALQYRVVDSSLISFTKMIKNLTNDLQTRGTVDRGAEFVIATMNDCQHHMTYLEDMCTELLTHQDLRSKVDPLVDRVMSTLTLYADAGMRALSHMVMQDLGTTLGKLFGPAWVKGESPVGAVAATITDYLNEFESSLSDYYVNKLALDLTARAVVAYLRLLDMRLNPSGADKTRGRGLKLTVGSLDLIKVQTPAGKYTT